MNVGRGYVIHNSESVSDEGGYRAARAAKNQRQQKQKVSKQILQLEKAKFLWLAFLKNTARANYIYCEVVQAPPLLQKCGHKCFTEIFNTAKQLWHTGQIKRAIANWAGLKSPMDCPTTREEHCVQRDALDSNYIHGATMQLYFVEVGPN